MSKLLSDIVAYRSYAKHLDDKNRRESLAETILRNEEMHINRFPKLKKEINAAYKLVKKLEDMPSMRSLQFGGNAIERNNVRMFNCSYLSVEYVRAFSEILYVLLCGTGVGFSVQRKHISKLPALHPPTENNYYRIHDSIEGWAEALNQLVNAYMFGGLKPIFDYSDIRDKNSYLSTTGAKAPGPQPLKEMLEHLDQKFKDAVGRKLTSLEIHDIICIISDCVLAGGIRRAALISIFDKDDNQMLECKQGNWWEKHPYRARANNSVMFIRDKLTKEDFKKVYDACIKSNCGEPGFLISESEDFGTNPCFSGDTYLKTEDGFKTFESLDGQTLNLINYKNEIVQGSVWKSGKKQTIVLNLSNNDSLCCTPNHKFMLQDETEEIAQNLIGKVLFTGEQVVSISLGFEIDVYDFNLQDNTHWGIVNGIDSGNGYVAHNCGEIGLNSQQFCNLTTASLTGITKPKLIERVSASALIGTLQASYTNFPFLSEKWKINTEKEALLGCSFTGVADAPQLSAADLRLAARTVKEVNRTIAHKIGINESARLTCVKPEGSASCVLNSSSGIHDRFSEYYLRRVRMSKNDPLAEYLIKTIPDLVEGDLFSNSGVVVTIPQKSPKNSITRDQTSAKQLLDRACFYYDNWVVPGHTSGIDTHNVSVTINYKPEEVDDLFEYLWEKRNSFRGVSLLPFDGGTYKQAPFEACDKKTFDKLNKLVKDVDLKNIVENHNNTNLTQQLACAGGTCEI
jgi:hypothetical protein